MEEEGERVVQPDEIVMHGPMPVFPGETLKNFYIRRVGADVFYWLRGWHPDTDIIPQCRWQTRKAFVMSFLAAVEEAAKPGGTLPTDLLGRALVESSGAVGVFRTIVACLPIIRDPWQRS
jgi:hypothetical protein